MKLLHLRSIALAGALVLLHPTTSQAQIFGAANDTAARVWRVRFQADIKVKSLSLTETDRYEGERYATNPLGARYWEWISTNTTTREVHKTRSIYSQRLAVSVNVWDELYAGFGYTSLIVVPPFNPNGNFVASTKTAFSTHATLTYRYRVPLKVYLNRISICPQIAYGAYMSAPTDAQGFYGNMLEGPGKERFAEGLLAVEVTPFRSRNTALRAWVGYSQFMYRESETSFVYRDKTRTVKANEQLWAIGLGLCHTLSIHEDAVPAPKVKKEKKARKKRG